MSAHVARRSNESLQPKHLKEAAYLIVLVSSCICLALLWDYETRVSGDRLKDVEITPGSPGVMLSKLDQGQVGHTSDIRAQTEDSWQLSLAEDATEYGPFGQGNRLR